MCIQIVTLEVGRTRNHDVSHLRRFGEKDIVDYQKLQIFESFFNGLGARYRHQRILEHNDANLWFVCSLPLCHSGERLAINSGLMTEGIGLDTIEPLHFEGLGRCLIRFDLNVLIALLVRHYHRPRPVETANEGVETCNCAASLHSVIMLSWPRPDIG